MTDSEQQQTVLDPTSLRKLLDTVVRPLSHSSHKGQSGRIGVIGGSRDFTGAPYFAAISALKVGSDLAYVFCSQDSALAIKSYSPELIVLPVLSHEDNGLSEITTFLPKLHSLVIGPGLGRDESVEAMIVKLIPRVRERNIPVVIDADALNIVINHPTIVQGVKKMVLTPNKAEFARLLKAMGTDPVHSKEDPVHSKEDPVQSERDPVQLEDGDLQDVRNCAKSLDGPALFVKGRRDVITDGNVIVCCEEENSARRCGGQGDILAGSIASFSCWTNESANLNQTVPSNILACFAASMLTRRCNKLAFTTLGRSMMASDMIKLISTSFRQLFPID